MPPKGGIRLYPMGRAVSLELFSMIAAQREIIVLVRVIEGGAKAYFLTISPFPNLKLLRFWGFTTAEASEQGMVGLPSLV